MVKFELALSASAVRGKLDQTTIPYFEISLSICRGIGRRVLEEPNNENASENVLLRTGNLQMKSSIIGSRSIFHKTSRPIRKF